jgi:hypothetical protein
MGNAFVLKGNCRARALSFAVCLFAIFTLFLLEGCASFEPGISPPPREDAEERPGLFSGEKGRFEFDF